MSDRRKPGFALLALMLATGGAANLPAALYAKPLLHPVQAEVPQGETLPPDRAADSMQAALRLTELLRMPDLLAIMQAEGQEYGGILSEELFPGKDHAAWDARVALIYDADRMAAEFRSHLALELTDAPETVAAAQAFFASALGQRIIGLEIEARRALLDDAVEEAAQAAVADMELSDSPRLDALRRFAETCDLIEMNVMGAMNASFAFSRGMNAEGGFGDGVSEGDLLADVWSQEPDIRAETEIWLWPYLALAYQPLSDEELQLYQAYMETEAGQRLNAAIFAAFDKVFNRISEDLGRAAARQLLGEDI